MLTNWVGVQAITSFMADMPQKEVQNYLFSVIFQNVECHTSIVAFGTEGDGCHCANQTLCKK